MAQLQKVTFAAPGPKGSTLKIPVTFKQL